VLRGACISLYALREASQGENLYLDVKKFLNGKNEESKAYHHRYDRVGFQRKAPQNNFRRLIAAPIPKKEFCFESIKYIPAPDGKFDLDLIMALLNSQVLDWYFRLSSTNAQVNEYQFNLLPVPIIHPTNGSGDWLHLVERGQWSELTETLLNQCMDSSGLPHSVANALSQLSRVIQEIESSRKINRRTERSGLHADSQPIQQAIDTVLYRCYGLSADEACYIGRRLEEML